MIGITFLPSLHNIFFKECKIKHLCPISSFPSDFKRIIIYKEKCRTCVQHIMYLPWPVFRVQANWMCREHLRTSYRRTLWDPPPPSSPPPAKVKVIHLVMTEWSSEWVLQTVTLLQKHHSVPRRYGSCEIQFRTEFSFMIVMWKRKLIQIMQRQFHLKFTNTTYLCADKISKWVKKLWTSRHFNWHKATKKK
jgi:hypothetical protein